MKPLSHKARRALIRIAYLSPAAVGAVLLIYACIPHLFFIWNGTAYDTLSPLSLVGRTWSECRALGEASSASGGAVMFSFVMTAAVVVFWICLILYASYAVAVGICSCRAFAFSPTDAEANRAKRWMQFFCPNRPLFVLSGLLPIVCAAFPTLLLSCYRNYLFYDMSLGVIGIPDLLLAALLCLLSLSLYLFTLRAQAEEHMDLFRLYKAK